MIREAIAAALKIGGKDFSRHSLAIAWLKLFAWVLTHPLN